jgi:DNA-binding NarL/FixJ family response regulator
MSLRVLLADDQAMVRSGFRLILDSQPDITVAAEAANGTQAVALARDLRPDVCLVDIRMPGLDGIEVTRALAGPGVTDPLRVVIVTTYNTPAAANAHQTRHRPAAQHYDQLKLRGIAAP